MSESKCAYCGDNLSQPWWTQDGNKFCSQNCMARHAGKLASLARGEQQTLDHVIDLVRRMHQEGVTKFKMDLRSGAIEVEFAPEFVSRPELGVDTSIDVAAPPHDPSLCVRCQKAPPGGLHPGHCRQCSLEIVGVS